jgi:hypothetical protein
MAEFLSECEILILGSIFPPTPAENRAVYEIMWKNIVELDMQKMATQHGAKKKRDAICMSGT